MLYTMEKLPQDSRLFCAAWAQRQFRKGRKVKRTQLYLPPAILELYKQGPVEHLIWKKEKMYFTRNIMPLEPGNFIDYLVSTPLRLHIPPFERVVLILQVTGETLHIEKWAMDKRFL